MLENNILLLFFAILGGALPPLIWLFFWLHEDAHPEPKPMIVATFLGGVLIVPLAVILENIWQELLEHWYLIPP
jgi:RsiW-degrading membrane proteinase PrsW (M82 family)